MSESFIKKVFMSNSYFIVTKSICQIVDPNAAVLLSMLIDKYFYWKETGKLGADGSFFKDRREIESEISLTRKKREAAQRTLLHFQFLSISKTNPAGYNYFVINWDNLQDAWTDPVGYKSRFEVEPEDDACAQNVPNDLEHVSCTDLGTNRAEACARNVHITENSSRRTQTEQAHRAMGEPRGEDPQADMKSSEPDLITLKHAILANCGDRNIPDASSLEMAIQMCKDGGVPIDDMSSREMLRICFTPERVRFFKNYNSGRKEKIDVQEWQDRLAGLFEKLVAQIYLVDIVDATVVKKAKAAEPSVKHRNGDVIISAEKFDEIMNLPEDDFPGMDFNFDEEPEDDQELE